MFFMEGQNSQIVPHQTPVKDDRIHRLSPFLVLDKAEEPEKEKRCARRPVIKAKRAQKPRAGNLNVCGPFLARLKLFRKVLQPFVWHAIIQLQICKLPFDGDNL